VFALHGSSLRSVERDLLSVVRVYCNRLLESRARICFSSSRLSPRSRRSSAFKSGEPKYGSFTVEQWKERLKNIDPAAPQSAALVPGLIALVEDRNVPSTVRQQAASTLGRIGKPAAGAVPVLVDLLKKPDESDGSTFHWSAKALALFQADAREAAPPLIEVVQDNSRPTATREVALETLTYIGTAHPRVVPTLIALLQNPPSGELSRANDEASFRANAAASLGIIGSGASAAVPALARATRDPFEAVRRNAAVSLGAMGGQAEVALPALVDALLSDDSPAVQDEAARAIAKVGPPAIPVLERLLQDDEPQARKRAAAALGSMGPPAKAVRDALIAALNDADADVRLTAAESLWAITGEAEPIVPTLVNALSSDDRQIRLRASRQLIALKDQARTAIKSIRSLLKDKNPQVRRVAAQTIEKLGASE
jgi:HEAT repeat protein